MSEIQKTGRRGLLRKGALLLGGAVGIGLTGGAGIAASTGIGTPAKEGKLAFSLRGENWQLIYPDRPRGVLPQPGQRSNAFGQLFSVDEGSKVGEFYASSFQFGAPFGPGDLAAGAMETHQFNLIDGTIIGIGTPADLHGTRSVHAIIGGTGRYEGASGSYAASQRPTQLGGDGSAEFVFNVIVRSA